MAEKIVVSSVGLVTALGLGIEANMQAMRQLRSGLRHPVHLQTIHAGEFVMGEVEYSNRQMAELLQLPADHNYSRTALLALVAMQEIINSFDIELLRKEPLALINAGTVGGMCTVEDLYPDFIAPGTGDYIRYIDSLDCAESTEDIAAYYKLKPLMATISTACSSSANALMLGARMIKQGLVKRAICGGCDALSRFTLNGFNSLKNVAKEPCKPFDRDRVGLNLGEGAAYLLLETEASAKERGARILAELSGYCNSNDAYHPTAPSPYGEGAYNTMQQAMKMAGLQPGDIGYINAHGTATINNDIAEGTAISRLFDGKIPYFSSTKPFTGHTLAAAGAIEAIFSIAAMREGIVLPNMNFDTPMEELPLAPNTQLVEHVDIQHVLSNSFGFGGNNVSLAFSAL
ncbi:MAG: beta-ketoacyl-[acyl-carrier-protein] synthase family protein [Bacteroidetes bacterium]|nr:beta-ketoacyl-[acyl-carrier-protein] synthase family protein [Bacteroidota bacterium]